MFVSILASETILCFSNIYDVNKHQNVQTKYEFVFRSISPH